MSFCSRKLSQLDNFLSSVCCSCFLLFLFLSLSPSPLLFFPPSLLPFLSLEHLIGCWTQSPNYSPLFPFHFLVLQLYFMGDFTPLYLLMLLILLFSFSLAVVFLFSKSSLSFLEFSHHTGSSSCFMNALACLFFLRILIVLYMCVCFSSPCHLFLPNVFFSAVLTTVLIFKFPQMSGDPWLSAHI